MGIAELLAAGNWRRGIICMARKLGIHDAEDRMQLLPNAEECILGEIRKRDPAVAQLLEKARDILAERQNIVDQLSRDTNNLKLRTELIHRVETLMLLKKEMHCETEWEIV